MSKERLSTETFNPLKHTDISLPPSFVNEKQDPDLFAKTVTEGGQSLQINKEKETVNITPVDFFSIPKNISGDEMIKFIETRLDTNDIKEHLDIISKCFKEARSFLIKYLHQDIPREIKEIDGFKTVTDFSHFLEKSTAKGEGAGTGFVPFYCAIQSIMIAEWESHKKGFENLQKESEYVYNSLFNPSDENDEKSFHKTRKRSDNWDKIIITNEDNTPIQALSSYRGKNIERLVCKIINKPEIDTEQIIKDGIGLKFEVQTEEYAINLANFLANYFNQKFTTKDLEIENNNLISSELKNITKNNNIKILNKNKNNTASLSNFKALKVEGKIEIPKGGITTNLKQLQNFEIQIFLTNNDTEKGLSKHEIYEAKQKISTYGRLFGSITEKYLDLICDEAHQKTGIDIDDIKQHILDTTLQKIDSSGKNRYVVSEHYERLKKTNLLPKKLKVIEKYQSKKK